MFFLLPFFEQDNLYNASYGSALAPKDAANRKEPFAPLGKYVAIPKRYHNADTSGLSCTIGKGRETKYDIPLDP